MRLQLRTLLCLLGFLGTTGCVHHAAKPLATEARLSALEARSLTDPGLVQFIQDATGHAPAPWPPTALDLETLSWVAFYFHPSLEVARAQWAVARASIKTASARPNPVLSAQPGYNFSASGGSSPWIPGVNLDWPIETAGKRGYRISRSQYLAESARWSVHQAAWQARGALRLALLDLTTAERRASLLERQASAAKSLNDLLQQRLQAGAVSRLELSASQLNYIKTTGELADARRLSADARARVAEATGLPLTALEGRTLQVDINASLPVDETSAASQLHKIALQNRSDVRSLLAEYAASESTLQLEVARQYPDVHLGNGYQWDQGDSKWSLGLTLEIPAMHRNQGLIAESLAKRDEVGARFNALQSRVISEVDRATSAYKAAQEQLARSADLMTAHERQLSLLRSAVKAGASDQVELRTAEIESAAAELLRLDAQVKAQQALGDLQQALQHPLNNASLLEKSPREIETPTAKP